MKIVKAEILWSRTCHLKCSYCKMADGRRNTLPIYLWKQGIDNLKMLGCKFIAFYGAEPLIDFYNLPDVVRYAENVGIKTTVITSGAANKVHEKLKMLYHSGCRSLTMSYDMIPLDNNSRLKSSKIDLLDYFKSLGPIRDLAVVATLTRKSFHQLPSTIERMTEKGIWTFFDFLHPDRGQYGSKTNNTAETERLLFQDSDLPYLTQVLDEVLSLKKQGYLCHTSKSFIDMIQRNGYELINNYSWNCANYIEFPSWITIDCDGLAYPCDDFQPGVSPFHINNIFYEFQAFEEYFRPSVESQCPGCCWNTHIDAHLIKSGKLPIADYIHGD